MSPNYGLVGDMGAYLTPHCGIFLVGLGWIMGQMGSASASWGLGRSAALLGSLTVDLQGLAGWMSCHLIAMNMRL